MSLRNAGRAATPPAVSSREPGLLPGATAYPTPGDLLDAILDAVTVGVVIHRRDGVAISSNTAADRLLDGLPSVVLANAVAPVARTAGHPSSFTLTTPRPDGTDRRLLATAVPLARDGQNVTAVVTTLRDLVAEQRDGHDDDKGLRDLTVEHHLRRALGLAERRLRATVENSPVGTAVLTPEGRLLQANRTMCRLLGRTGAEMVGLTLADVTHPDDLVRESAQLGRLAAGEIGSYELEKRYVRPGGDSVWVRVTVGSVADDDGTVLHLVAQAQDVTETRLAVEMLTHQALHDPLTGLPNRTLCVDRIQQALDRGRRTGRRVAVLTLDLDDFKVINDSIGPDHGDAVLLEVARRLRDVLSARDTAARLSGDEFVVVSEDVASDAEAVDLARRLLVAVRQPVELEGRVVVPTASVGIAVSTPRDGDALVLLRDAGTALHRAKQDGRGSWDIVDEDLRRRAVDRLDTESQLRSALASDQLRLHLQPIVDLTTGRVVGREALVRWQHPSRGLLAPAAFVPVAEEAGLIDDLGRWVLGEATRVAARTPELGYVAVNVSPSQVRRPGLVDDVELALQSSGLAASQLVVELTESVMLGTASAGRRQLELLDDLGVRLVVDDFGTGFSALSHLRDLPVSGIKIDRSFTQGLGRDSQCDRIVEAVTGLAQGLGVDLVAEGVETENQASLLAGIGCQHAQGYLFGRPEPVPA